MGALLLTGCSTGPVEVASPDLTAGEQRACDAFLDALPAQLAGLEPREVSPTDAPARAYGDDGLTVVCGVGVAQEMDRFSECNRVLGVDWFFPPSEYADDDVMLTATTVGYRPAVSLVVPADYRGNVSEGAFADLVKPIDAHLKRVRRCL